MLWIATKSKERMTERLKALTSRNRGRKIETVIGNLNTYLRGWLAYYRLASAKGYLRETEAWLRRRLRCYRLKQCKRPYTIVKFLMRNGVPRHRAWLLAGSRKGWYRMLGTPQAAEAMSNEWFVKQGLIPLVLPVG